MAVGAPRDDDGGNDGARSGVCLWAAMARSNPPRKISRQGRRFTGSLKECDNFGSGLTNIGDVNQDGVTDLAVGRGPG